jgi:hypothetical protein
VLALGVGGKRGKARKSGGGEECAVILFLIVNFDFCCQFQVLAYLKT